MPEGIDRMRAHPLANLKPLVKEITFVPSQHSTGMTLLHCRQIVMKQCSVDCPVNCRIDDHYRQREESTAMELESAWVKNPVFTPEELLDGYNEYHRQAQAAQALLTDGSLQVWIDTIKESSNVKTFGYGRFKRHGVRSRDSAFNDWRHVFRERECKIHPDHPHDDNIPSSEAHHRSSVCQGHAARTQAGLVESISACINRAGAKPDRLILSSAFTTFEPECPLPPNFRNLDFSHLRTLEWRAAVVIGDSYQETTAYERNAFLMALLQKCHTSLQELRTTVDNIDEEGPSDGQFPFWPPRKAAHLSLPDLRQLYLTGFVAPRHVASWIASMPRLITLNMWTHPGYMADYGCRNWRLVLDAIRKHSSLVQIGLEMACEMVDNGRNFMTRISMCTTKSGQNKCECEAWITDDYMNGFEYNVKVEEKSLSRWLEGEQEWDSDLLDDFFPFEDGAMYEE
jgi:hypothetical protein